MRFLTDENFDNCILEGGALKNPDLDVIRVQDTEVYRLPILPCWLLQLVRGESC